MYINNLNIFSINFFLFEAKAFSRSQLQWKHINQWDDKKTSTGAWSQKVENFNCKLYMSWINFCVASFVRTFIQVLNFQATEFHLCPRLLRRKSIKLQFGTVLTSGTVTKRKCLQLERFFRRTLKARASTEKPRMSLFIHTKWILNPSHKGTNYTPK